MDKSYKVLTCESVSNLVEKLETTKIIDKRGKKDDHIGYLVKYLECLSVKTIVLEYGYIDKDYLEDYSRYYSKCFREYEKKCKRLHFFSTSFEQKDLDSYIANYDGTHGDRLQLNYLGFIVLRPLPKAFLGRVCLAAFGQENDCFPVVRCYRSHLMGLEFKVNTLAFQEQDDAVSACATSAIWSALHGTEQGNIHHISSPYEITLNANKLIGVNLKSPFPDKGLLPEQMAHAIREEGLKPMITAFLNTSFLKAILRAYLQVRVPVILGMTLYYEDEGKILSKGYPKNIILGLHAVTAVGYHWGKDKSEFNVPSSLKEENQQPLYLRSSRIDKLYVHDDRIGPFTQMCFKSENWMHLKTEWFQYREEEEKEQINATVDTLLYPLYHKIRIQFHTVFYIINNFNNCCTEVWNKLGIQLEWDIYLSTVCELKKKILEADDSLFPEKECRLEMLSYQMPRYIWVADAYAGLVSGKQETLNFSFYFDATDIDNSDLFICALHYNGSSYWLNYNQASLVEEHNLTGDISSNYQARKILSYYLKEDSEKIIYPKKDFASMSKK